MSEKAKIRTWLGIIAFLLSYTCSAAFGSIIYVDANATGANDGTSWADAYKYLQDALADADSSGDVNEIWVAEGIYRPDCNSSDPNGSGNREATFQLISGVTIYGGFPSDGNPNINDREPDLYETILSGDLNGDDGSDWSNRTDNSYHVVTAYEIGEEVILDGFVVTGGNANGSSTLNQDCGGGLYIPNGSLHGRPTVVNCIFTMNAASGYGGGMSNEEQVILKNCKFYRNVAQGGGGMHNDILSRAAVVNCTFSGNVAANSGGAISNSDSGWLVPLLFTNCILMDNSAVMQGGGMFNSRSDLVFTNCIIIHNFIDSGSYPGGRGGGVRSALGNQTFTNCVFWGNRAYKGPELSINAYTCTISFCNIQGGQGGMEVGEITTLDWGEGNIDEQPLLTPDGHLRKGSP